MFAWLAADESLAEAEDKLHPKLNSSSRPRRPPSLIPVYEKPTNLSRRKRPKAWVDDPGTRRAKSERLDEYVKMGLTTARIAEVG